MGDGCLRCHAPTDVYDGGVPAIWKKPGIPPIELLTPRATGRETGVDCMTCHLHEGRVLARRSYRRTPGIKVAPGFCQPLASNTFSSVYQCGPCHEAILEYGRYAQAAGGVSKAKSCNDCHMERGNDGEWTHYTYWAHDPPDKERPDSLAVFEHLRLEVAETGGAIGLFTKAELRIRLHNDFQGHGFFPNGPPTQYIIRLVMTGPDGRSFLEHEVYISSIFELQRAREHMAKVEPGSDTTARVITIGLMQDWNRTLKLPPDAPRSGTIELRVFEKEIFELPDSFAKLIFERRQEYDLD